MFSINVGFDGENPAVVNIETDIDAGIGLVHSVNGKIGSVVLSASDLDALEAADVYFIDGGTSTSGDLYM